MEAKISEKQSSSSGSEDGQKAEQDGIIEQINKRINNLKDTNFSHNIEDYIPKLIVSLVSMVSVLMTYQINSTSNYFGSGLRIPSHNVGIYIAKLNSYRSFLMMVGFAAEYSFDLIYHFLFNDDDLAIARKVFSLFFLYVLMASRGALLFSSFLSSDLSYRIYLFLCIEAIISGTFQMSLILLFPQYIVVIFISTHLLVLVFFLTQFVFDFFLFNKPLTMIRIQFCMCLIVTIVCFGLWTFYLFYYHDTESKSYKVEIYKQTKNLEKANSVYQKLISLSQKTEQKFEEISTKLKDSLYEDDITNELDIIKLFIHEFLDSFNDFVTLINEISEFIKKTFVKSGKLESQYKKNTSDLDTEKNRNNFSTQKTKYYDDKFIDKVKKVNKMFEEFETKENRDILASINKLSNNSEEFQKISKLFSNNDGFGNQQDLDVEIKSLQKRLSEIYGDNNIFFSFDSPSNNEKSIDQVGKESDELEEKINKKINESKSHVGKFKSEIIQFEKYIKNLTDLDNQINNILFDEPDYRIFSYIMISVACFFRDFLYPSIIPHALLIESEAQKILLLGVILQLLFCFPVLILDNLLNIFTLLTEKYFIYFWTLASPPFIVLVFTFLGIHTKIPFFHLITGSTGRVFILALLLISCCTLMESVSYTWVSHYIFNQLGFSHKNLLFLLFHQLLEMFYTYFFSKLSAGYNHARVRMGHCLPTYTTNYDMTFCEELWSMIKWTVQYTFKDIFFFFKMNIRQYL